MKTQSVKSTAYPNGKVDTYTSGMPKPEPKCLSEYMRAAALKQASVNRFKTMGV